jgi:hypothetical protein
MTIDSNYSDAWRDLRRRRLVLLLVWLAYIPVELAALRISTLAGVKFNYIGPSIAVLWMVLLGIAGLRVATFPCPHCGEWFFAKWWFHNPFARKCVHCGLPKSVIT